MFFVFKQKTAYEMRISDWSSDVCSSDLWALTRLTERQNEIAARAPHLAPLICRDYSPSTWEEVRSHFTDHTSEGISTDAGGFNPFRPAFRELLPKENFLESLMRRPEERRVGNEGVRTGRSRWSPY